jgi:very-short-patch-repair endonuclease
MRDHVLLERAKAMRREATAPEQRLWLELRAKRFGGAKFRRQVVVDNYIVDFACRTPCMVAIEVDGETHASNAEYDAARSRFLERKGYRVIRFTNSEVMTNLDGVLQTLEQFLQLPLSPTLSHEGEREKV